MTQVDARVRGPAECSVENAAHRAHVGKHGRPCVAVARLELHTVTWPVILGLCAGYSAQRNVTGHQSCFLASQKRHSPPRSFGKALGNLSKCSDSATQATLWSR